MAFLTKTFFDDSVSTIAFIIMAFSEYNPSSKATEFQNQ